MDGVKLDRYTHTPNFPVITPRGLLQESLVLGHLLLVWEGDTVYALKSIIIGVAKEVRR